MRVRELFALLAGVASIGTAQADERLWATPLDSMGYAAPWTTGPVRVAIPQPAFVQVCADPNNMSRITYSEDAADLGRGPELDPGACDCRFFGGDHLWIRAPWTAAYSASAIQVAMCPTRAPAGTLGSNAKAGARQLVPPDGSAIIVGGAIGQKVLEVERPKSPVSNSTVRVYGSTHIVQRDEAGAICAGGPGCTPDLTTQGSWELYPGERDRAENFNGTYWVWAPGGYDAAAKGKQYIDHRKQGISQSYGPAPAEIP